MSVLVPEHRQSVVMEVFDHREAEAGLVADVLVRTLVHLMTQTRAGIGLTESSQTRILVQQARQRAVHSVQI